MKILYGGLALMVFGLGLLCPRIEAAQESLYARFSRAGVVKVFVENAVDVSKDQKADVAGLKAAIEKALTERKSVRFQIVQDKALADIRVESSVKDYYWTDSDPVDMIMGAAAVAYDVATKENYARLTADLKVYDAKNDSPLWWGELIATQTDKQLTQDKAPSLINDEMSSLFVRKCFGKKRA